MLRRIVAMGLRGTERHWSLIPPDLARRAQPHVMRVGDGLLTLMRKSDALRLNRVSGLGHRGQASKAVIDAIIERYRSAGVKRFSLRPAPGPQATRIERWLVKRGFTRRGGSALLLRDCRKPVPRAASDLRVARAGLAHRQATVDILGESFPITESRRGWWLAAAGAPGYEHFMAFSGKTPVAVAALRVEDDLAWLGGASTRVRWRRRGAQSALIAARLRRAARLGCRWAWSETAAPAPGRPDGSRRNLLRLGFKQVGLDPTYVWQEGH